MGKSWPLCMQEYCKEETKRDVRQEIDLQKTLTFQLSAVVLGDPKNCGILRFSSICGVYFSERLVSNICFGRQLFEQFEGTCHPMGRKRSYVNGQSSGNICTITQAKNNLSLIYLHSRSRWHRHLGRLHQESVPNFSWSGGKDQDGKCCASWPRL